mmetsp:Transcript_13969/g.45781  ORF Transcript_13969/g.45781 Transcript_13969/m.45781 type:complete len:469 (-) Transcript_13969:196-1602(-)
MAVGGTGARLRPSIYVYELPAKFNTWLAETRVTPEDCVYRRYVLDNLTKWENYAFGLELALHESLLSSPHRTLNPHDADFFFVPVQGGCFISRFTRPTPRHNLYVTKAPVGAPILGNEHYRSTLDWIRSAHPFWNASRGADHLWAFPHDEGACVAPIEIEDSILISSWGRYTPKPPNATTSAADQSWYHPAVLPRMYASRQCFKRGKDIVMPVFTAISQLAASPHLASAPPPAPRTTLFHFRGQILRRVSRYSMGIRQQLLAMHECKTGSESASRKEMEGVRSCGDVIVSDRHSPLFLDEMRSSTFCGVFPGNGWGHIETPLLLGCIPVVVQDEILTPWEDVLDFSSFAIRLPRSQLPNLVPFLRTVPPSRVAQLQAGGKRVWERFTYSSLGLAERRRACGGAEFTPAADGCRPRLGLPMPKRGGDQPTSQAFLADAAITGQDAVATLLQLLRARLAQREAERGGGAA